MTQPCFEVQVFDGHGWVIHHRGTDVDSAGAAAKRVLPNAKKNAVRIVRQSFDSARNGFDEQVVFALGKPRRRLVRRTLGVAAAFSLSVAAIVGATLVHRVDAGVLVALIDTDQTEAAVETDASNITADADLVAPDEDILAALTPASGTAVVFDCDREAERGLIRPVDIDPALERLFGLCGQAIQGHAVAQTALAGLLAAGEGNRPGSRPGNPLVSSGSTGRSCAGLSAIGRSAHGRRQPGRRRQPWDRLVSSGGGGGRCGGGVGVGAALPRWSWR